MKKNGNIFVISAPSGAGKSSLVKALCTLDDTIKVSISHTTRAPRGTEIDGKDYFFVNHEEFKNILKENGFIEHAIVYDNYYGTSFNFVKTTIRNGYDLILEIDWQGAAQIKNLLPEATLIYILPPSQQVLSARLYNRDTDSPEVIAKRLSLAQEDISHAHKFDFCVINDDFNTALNNLYCIICSLRFKSPTILENYTF